MARNSNDEYNFPHKLSLTNPNVSWLANGSSANIKLAKTQLYKIAKSWGFLHRYLGPLLKTVLSLVKSVLTPLARSVLLLQD